MTEKLFGVGEIVSERDIVSFSLLVFPKSWENFIEEKMISVSTLERKWYEVVFSRGKALMKHLKSRVVKQIGVSVKNLYRLKFEIEASLSSREISMHKCDPTIYLPFDLGTISKTSFCMMEEYSPTITSPKPPLSTPLLT